MQEQATFQLVMERGPNPGRTFELARGTISIGRDPGNNVVINDPQISRQHARITPQGGLFILEDLGSTNGTTVNGFLVQSAHTLAHGDHIGLGDNVTLVFHGGPDRNAGDTVAAPRAVYAPPYEPYRPAPAPAYEEPPYPAYAPYEPAYAAEEEPDYTTYGETYEEYPEEAGRDWTLIGLGCLLVAIIVGLLLAIYVYFFAPASIVDPIIDFLAGFGINVP